MEMNKKNRGLVCALLVAVLLGAVFCGNAVAGDAVLETVPANCVFCVKLNNFNYTLSQVDQFIAGASPMGPMGPSMMARMQLANMLGDPMLQGLDMAGSFAIFGMVMPKTAEATEPDLLVAALLPVKDYQLFVSLSPNVNEPDDAGVSTITIRPMMAMPAGPNAPPPPAKILLCIKAGPFAMVASEGDRTKLLAAAKSISSGQGSMGKGLDADQTKLAADMPIWAYVDIEQVNKVFGPTIQKFFEQAKGELKKGMASSGAPQPANIAEIMNVYFDMAKAFLEQGKYVSIAIKPEPAVLRIKKTLAAKPDTNMAKLLTAGESLPKQNKLIAQLGDGAAINAAVKVDKAWMKELSKFGMSFMKAGATSDANAADEMPKWDQIIKDSVDSMGQVLAFSLKSNTGGKPPFAMEYYVEVEDKEKFDKVQNEYAELMKTGAFGKMYGEMGMEMSFDINRGVSEYKGVSIDTAKLSMKATDTNSPEAQMVQAMYGDGLDYRMAHVNGLYLTAISGDPDATIKKMIDSVKAGAEKKVGGEMAAAMALLGGAEDADFVGTINYIRLMGMVMSFVPMPMPIPFDQIPTASNIAFAGNIGNGKLVADVAVPKEHIMEFVAGMQMLMQPQQPQQGGPTMGPGTIQ